MHYELWEMLSRNMLADFSTEAEALTDIRELLEILPLDVIDKLVLMWRDREQGGTFAEGAELAGLARTAGRS